MAWRTPFRAGQPLPVGFRRLGARRWEHALAPNAFVVASDLVPAGASRHRLGARGATPPAPRVAATPRTGHNGSMTKSELIHRIAQKQSQLVERDVETAVKMMLDHMTQCLAGGGRIEIRGIGSFSLRLRRARVGRNPRTGTPVSLPARYAVYFKPGLRLRERVNRAVRGPAEG